ncbi:hypothetical protein GGI05_002173, partial [Coemansia sp. RSA 2603]
TIMPFYGEDIGSALLTNGPGYCYVYDDVPTPPAFRPRREARLAFNAMFNATESPLIAPSRPLHSATVGSSDGFSGSANIMLYDKDNLSDVDYEAPRSMDIGWLKSRHMDVGEAERMQRLVDDVVAQMNAERKQGRD